MSFEVVQSCNPRIHEAEEKRIKSFVLIPLGLLLILARKDFSLQWISVSGGMQD